MAGHLWLIGMMGAGKSTVGREVAMRRGVAFTDTDEEIAAAAGCSIVEVWNRRGEEGFREMEAAAVERLARLAGRRVIATGGGVVLRPASVAAMRRSGTVVWLAADPATLAVRTGDGEDRPLLAATLPEGRLTEILAARGPVYRRAAHAVVDTGKRTVDEVVTAVEAVWAPT